MAGCQAFPEISLTKDFLKCPENLVLSLPGLPLKSLVAKLGTKLKGRWGTKPQTTSLFRMFPFAGLCLFPLVCKMKCVVSSGSRVTLKIVSVSSSSSSLGFNPAGRGHNDKGRKVKTAPKSDVPARPLLGPPSELPCKPLMAAQLLVGPATAAPTLSAVDARSIQTCRESLREFISAQLMISAWEQDLECSRDRPPCSVFYALGIQAGT